MRLFRNKNKKREILEFAVAKPNKQSDGDKIKFVICVRNEAAAIEEWLTFHKAAGVDGFIIYDDDCSDRTIEIARSVVPACALEVVPWKQRLQDIKAERALQNQALAYAHAIANYRDDCRWMGFFDIDEFLFPTQAKSIRDVLDRLPDVDNIVLPWHMFGREGYEKTPELIIPSYKNRYRDPYDIRVKGILNFKSLINPAKATRAHIHSFQTSESNKIWNSNGDAFVKGQQWNRDFHASKLLQLNHYYIKSNAQLDEKIKKGAPAFSEFTSAFRTFEKRAKTLTRRANELDRDTVVDQGIIEFCKRAEIAA